MSISRARARHRVLAVVAGAAIAALSTGGAVSAAPQDPPVPAAAPTAQSAAVTGDGRALAAGRYIVAFAEQPAAGYRGGVRGFPATAPAKGEKFNAASAAAQRYRARLSSVHADALAAVGAQAFHDYTVAFNGVATHLTARQARALSKDPRVLGLVEDELAQPTTDRSPEVLGLETGLWEAVGGAENAGAGVIVGIIDTGIWPENPSFAGSADKRRHAGRPVPTSGIDKAWRGQCEAGEQFDVQDCNDKIIGARYYVDGFGRAAIAREEFLSPRDGNGHGSHTASTAAGNRVEDVVVDGQHLGAVSGMAPAAQIAAYKVCWTGTTSSGCAASDSVAAIDDAVADGVDVINYSIGGGSESVIFDPVEVAFLYAAAANVFVSVSAGNSGPGASTLDHPSPWLTTVAASTHRVAEQKLVLGDAELVGVSTTASLGQTEMVLAVGSGAAGVPAEQAAICDAGTLDPALVTGKLVVCERRGLIARIAKSFEVRRAGGVGMVLVNDSDGMSLNGDLHAVPAVHLPVDALDPVYAYVRNSPGATGAIQPLAEGDPTTEVPEVADFSSRGPSTTTGGDILKPDVAAPGVSVLAAVAPPTHHGRDYDLMSGTSMAAPHVAGLAAVLRQAHTDWSPMAVKSALMTTAGDHVSTSSPFEQGAGFVAPNAATGPGVVFDHGMTDWQGYLETVLQRDIWAEATPVDGSQLNQASVALGALAGTQTVTRTLTSVSGVDQTYTFDADLEGVDVTVRPAAITVPAGGTGSVDITFTRDTAAYDQYVTGHLTARSADHTVRLPVAVRPVAAAVDPAEVHGTGSHGTGSVAVVPGFTGPMSTSVTGLVGVTPEADSVPTGAYADAFDPLAPASHASVDVRDLEVAAGTSLLRLAVDAADPDDLDLWLYRLEDGAERLVDYSATASGDEQVTLVDPEPGQYRAYVHGWGVDDGAYTWSQWLLAGGAVGNLVVDPAQRDVLTGEGTTFDLHWSGLDPTLRYLGWVGFLEGEAVAGRTIVSIG